MTETSILPGASLESDAGNSMVPPPGDVEETGGDNRRRLMILGMVAAIVVIVAAAYMLLHKGSSSSPTPAAAPPVPASSTATGAASGGTPAKTTKTGSAAKAGTKLPHKSKTPLVRDPFKALISAPVAASSTSPSNQQTGGTTDVGSQPATNPAPTASTPTVTSPTSPTTGAAVTSGSPLWIQLISVQGTKSAIFDVGYAHHKFRRFQVIAPSPTSARGTVFDGEFALLGIQGDDVTIQVGDDTPFDLTHGVSHSV